VAAVIVVFVAGFAMLGGSGRDRRRATHHAVAYDLPPDASPTPQASAWPGGSHPARVDRPARRQHNDPAWAVHGPRRLARATTPI
jgi:hypothetical protein